MKISEIKIAPIHTWQDLSIENPLKATVKLKSDETSVETVLDDCDMNDLLDLVQHIIARAAKRNIDNFVAMVSGGHSQMIEGE